MTGILDVVEADIKRRLPDRIISDVIDYQREYGCLTWAFESIAFQEFLRTELVKRSAMLGIPVPAIPVIPNSDKALRIESLQPHMVNGLIRLHATQHTLIDQLRHFPKADHDDVLMPYTCFGLWRFLVQVTPIFKLAPADLKVDALGRVLGRNLLCQKLWIYTVTRYNVKFLKRHKP
ncbi:hypothetical protein CSC14_2974 [Proteus mirabilis]|nr:hypothetical protein CSC14_2974 [Proteus mirabilis]